MQVDWNRKDKLPEETIKYLMDILTSIDIKINRTQAISNVAWHSVRYELDKIPGIGTNGKGISLAYAEASGIAEFFERLQSKQLVHEYYRINNSLNINEKSTDDMYLKHSEVIPNLSTKEIVGELFEFEKYKECKVFRSELNHSQEIFSEGLLSYLCGTNGYCAGNTKEEAIVQGISEIFERYVLKRIYRDEEPDHFPYFAEEQLSHTMSYSLLQSIKERGYSFKIVDCTCNGVYPVIGLILFNQKGDKYRFAIGSDPDFDIALQRCITEIFQGKKLGIVFNQRMLSILDDGFQHYSTMNVDREYLESARSGTGKLPTHILYDSKTTNNNLSPFSKRRLTNVEGLEYMLDIVKRTGRDIFIGDYSYLGFPTYRVYIPGYSELNSVNGEDIIANIKIIENFKLEYLKYCDSGLISNELLDFAEKLISMPRYRDGIKISQLVGILFKENEEIAMIDCPLQLIIYKKLRNGDYVDVINLLESHSSYILHNKQLFSLIGLYCQHCRQYGDSKEVLRLIKSIEIKPQILTTFLGLIGEIEISLPACPSCKKCNIVEHCYFEEWKEIMERLQHHF